MSKSISFFFLTSFLSIVAYAAVPSSYSTGPTAAQQGSGISDIEISRQIRKALMSNKSLSTYAKNVTVISIKGEVTLKGPVKSAVEQAEVVRMAQSVDGVHSLFNQTEIMTEK